MSNFDDALYIWFAAPATKPSSPKPPEDGNTATAASTLGRGGSVPWQTVRFVVFDLGLGCIVRGPAGSLGILFNLLCGQIRLQRVLGGP